MQLLYYVCFRCFNIICFKAALCIFGRMPAMPAIAISCHFVYRSWTILEALTKRPLGTGFMGT